MSKSNSRVVVKYGWSSCIYCTDTDFKVQRDFTRHLREKHCSQEGGSFVCRYGTNGVCSSLPVEGVSDEDYEDHVLRHHASRPHHGVAQKQQSDGPHWTVYSTAQNLPAVLNDPSRGKERDFFTKLWGDNFVEKIDVPLPNYLPDIGPQHFESYMKKVARRYRKHVRINANVSRPATQSELLHHFPHLRGKQSLEKLNFDISGIPKIFLQPSLDLTSEENFNTVFSFTKDLPSVPTTNIAADTKTKNNTTSTMSGILLQEKLSHYLDTVEVQIAQQVAHKSDAFFHAMTSHDALSEQMAQTVGVVRALREKIQHIDKSLVKDSLQIMRLERLRCNQAMVVYKLKLMATVHQTQPTIQLLLSTPDYVAALELIATTQEILVQELAGVHSFRHLGSQLLEMERLIDKMLNTEFERYATADLNRPLSGKNEILEGEKLVSIIFGMLRQKQFDFIDTYREEAFTTIKAVVKQMVIESVAASDCGDSEVALTGVGDQLQGLAIPGWLRLLQETTSTLLQLIHRIKAVRDVMQQAADVSAGKLSNSTGDAEDSSNDLQVGVVSDPGDKPLSSEEHQRVSSKLRELMISVCDYAHERLAQLVSSQDKLQERQGTCWLAEKATAGEVCDLARVIDRFTGDCEEVSGRISTALRSSFKVQASKFTQRFHTDRKTKLSLILESERWKQADVPAEFQDLVDGIASEGKFSTSRKDVTSEEICVRKPGNYLFYGKEKFAVVGTILLLLKMVAEYCECSLDLALTAQLLCRHLAELLQLFNSRCCQLVLGAGALQAAGLKTITSTNLALASRALQLLLVLLPTVKRHFQGLLDQHSQQPSFRSNSGVAALDAVEKKVLDHVQGIEEKILSIIINLVSGQLSQWEARAPVPSQPFRNISRHLTKLHEAIANILPEQQVQYIYKILNSSFKAKLRDQLLKMNVAKDGGPQHGVVTAELTFYLETLRTLQVMPPEELCEGAMSDIWESPR